MKNNQIVLLLLILVSGAAGWFLHGEFIKPPAPQIVQAKITDFQKQQIVTEARLNWIPLDSAKALLKEKLKPNTQIRWIDSVKWISKDSVHIVDSLISQKVPVYEMDTTLTFTKSDSLGNSAEITQQLLLRFFPLYEAFAPIIHIKSVKFTMKQIPLVEKPPFYDHFIWGVGVTVVIIYLISRLI